MGFFGKDGTEVNQLGAFLLSTPTSVAISNVKFPSIDSATNGLRPENHPITLCNDDYSQK